MNGPALRYPFEDSISPYAPELEALTRNWLYGSYPMLPAEIKRKYAQTQTGYLTARFFPLASYERLIPLSMSSLWGLAWDDYYEHAPPETFSSLKQHIGAIIRGAQPRTSENDFFQQMKIMADGFRRFMPSYWMERFARSMEIYIEGMAEEAPYKAALRFPSIEEYMEIRWKSVDVLQMIDGLEVATEMPLPTEIRHHPHLDNLAKLTCRIIAWCNDFFSADKEDGRDVMNLVLILQHQMGCSLLEAKREAIRVHNQDLVHYQELEAALPNFGPYHKSVEKFLDYNKLMIAGHWRWYITDTLRYQPGGSPDADTFRQC